ncbi:MAG: glycosyltransferase family 4 protein [Chlamydiales bacterium]|nr:glycosyltransferase family 4 protein [Chlamydiales bacterium]
MILSSGIGTYLRNLLFELRESPFRIELIVSPQAVEKVSWLSAFELRPCTAPIYSISEQIELPKIIPSCDLFWTPHLNIPLLPVRAKRRVATVHDAYHLAFFSRLRLQEKCYTKLIFSRLKRYANRIITDSEFSKSELEKYAGLSQEKIDVVPCGVDMGFFSAASAETEREEALSSLPKKFILFVGNLKPHKNVQGLIKAFEHLQKRGFSDHALVIVGKKAGLRTAEHAFFSNPQVLFLENIEDKELPLVYRRAALTVLPSFYEGFGLPPLEAMGCGCPVVVSRAASLPEVCGPAAEYVDPYDPLDIARGVEKVLRDPALQSDLKQKGFERASQFSWKRAAERHLQIFEEVINA